MDHDLSSLYDYWHPLATPHLFLRLDEQRGRDVDFTLLLRTSDHYDTSDPGIWTERGGERVPLLLTDPATLRAFYDPRGSISIYADAAGYGLLFDHSLYLRFNLRPAANVSQPLGLEEALAGARVGCATRHAKPLLSRP